MSTKDVNYITIDNVSEIQDIVNGDYLFTISNGVVYKLDFQNFIVGRDNIDFATTIDTLSAQVVQNTQELANNVVQTTVTTSTNSSGNTVSVFEFILSNDADGFADDSWENILAIGQSLQAPYFQNGSGNFTNQVAFPGTSTMPVIKIIATETEYNFRNTARIPPRFQLQGNTRWGSTFRFWSVGDKIVKDDTVGQRMGTTTFYNIGFYVEPGGNYNLTLQSGNFSGQLRPFEQTINGIIIVPQGYSEFNPEVTDSTGRVTKGNNCPTIPIYIAGSPDRLNISDVKIIATQGKNWLIKHGPAAGVNYYFNFYRVNQTNDNVFLIDPYFNNLQLEGDQIQQGNNDTEVIYPSCGMWLTGQNINISNIRMFYLQQGIYIYNSRSVTLTNINMAAELAGYLPSLMPVTIEVTEDYYTVDYFKKQNINIEYYREEDIPNWYINHYTNKEQLLSNQLRGIGSINMVGGNPRGLVAPYGRSVAEAYNLYPYESDTFYDNWVVPNTGLGMYQKDGIFGESFGSDLYNFNQWNVSAQSTIVY